VAITPDTIKDKTWVWGVEVDIFITMEASTTINSEGLVAAAPVTPLAQYLDKGCQKIMFVKGVVKRVIISKSVQLITTNIMIHTTAKVCPSLTSGDKMASIQMSLSKIVTKFSKHSLNKTQFLNVKMNKFIMDCL